MWSFIQQKKTLLEPFDYYHYRQDFVLESYKHSYDWENCGAVVCDHSYARKKTSY
jgi:hypothetical protein